MSDGTGKSFEEVLNEAPLAPEKITLMGTLERWSEPGKFRLTMDNGRSLVLPVASVGACTQFASPTQKNLVTLEVKAADVPSDYNLAPSSSVTEDLDAGVGFVPSSAWTLGLGSSATQSSSV